MIQQMLRKSGNSYVVTIPKEEVERRGLKEGQLLGIEITPLEVRPVLRPELRRAFDASWQRSEEAYRLLADEEPARSP
jgi:antitoxin component of MazEF toxin-antitoxin module